MDQSSVLKEAIRDELEQFDTYLLDALKNDNKRISEIVNYAFRSKGKRIRPVLVLLVAKSCGKITPATYHGAVTVELLHTATLIHDDVIDKSLTRRGKPSVNAVFDNTRSVLAGDYMLSSALVESVKTENLEIIGLISELGKNLSEGELNQYSLASEVIIDEAEYFKVIDKKTASLLYACAKIGAITAGSDRETIEELGKMGRYLGIAFQIRDDIFDYFKTDIGKPTGNDIREGKITLPLIYSLQNTTTESAGEMIEIIRSKEYTAENIEMLLDFAKTNGGIDYAQRVMEKYIDMADEIVRKTSLVKEYKVLLELLLIYLKNRSF